MPLAGVIGAGMPEPMVLLPILLDPMGMLLPDVEPYEPIAPDDPDEDLDESVEGAVMGAGAGTVPVSPTFLPQAPKARNATSATVVIAAVLIFGLTMRIP